MSIMYQILFLSVVVRSLGISPHVSSLRTFGYSKLTPGTSLHNNGIDVDWSNFFLPGNPASGPAIGAGLPHEHDTPNDSSALTGFPAVFLARSLHQEQYGHASVDPSWIVPCEYPWPEDLWGLKLLDVVVETDWTTEMAATSALVLPSDSQSLATHIIPPGGTVEEMGGCSGGNLDTHSAWDGCSSGHGRTGETSPDIVLECLHLHKQTTGHINVRRNWRVPKTHPWPTEMHGKTLGGAVARMRTEALRCGDVSTIQRLAVLGALPGEVCGVRTIST